MAYNGSVELISGIKQKNNGTFPLVDASAVRVDDSTRLPAALAGKVNTEDGKGLSTNDYTDADKSALDNIKTTDPDLETTGKAADAKATGDALDELKTQTNEEISEIRNILNSTIPKDEYSGRVVTINNDNDSTFPLQMTAEIEPLQLGSGTPSASNIRHIVGWEGVSIRRTGANLWGGVDMLNDIKSAISDATIDTVNHTAYFKAGWGAGNSIFSAFKPNTVYTVMITFVSNQARSNLQVYYTDGTHDAIPNLPSANVKGTSIVVSNSGKTIAYIRKVNSGGETTVYADESGIFEGTLTAADFVAYSGESKDATFNETVYGGALDCTNCSIEITKGYIASYNGETLPSEWISDRDVYAVGTTPTIGAQVVYDLAQSRKVDVWVSDVTMPTGTSNIFATTGNITFALISEPEIVNLIDTKLPIQEFEYGALSASGTPTVNRHYLRTIDYIDTTIIGFNVVSGYNVGVIIYNDNGSVSRDYWITSETTQYDEELNYRFDHNGKRYKLYIRNAEDTVAWDVAATVAALQFKQDPYAATKKYNENRSAEKEARKNDLNRDNVIYGLLSDNYKIEYANAAKQMDIRNCYGNVQNVHPKVLYFESGLFGHFYWMAYTPYPFSETSYENPCIAYSDDGYTWTDIPGNPIDTPDTGYYSDTHLLYNATTGELECWYRKAISTSPQSETIYRKTSYDGFTWSAAEILHTSTGGTAYLLSPAAYYDANSSIYRIWTVHSGTQKYIEYWESLDGTNWQSIRQIALSYQYGEKTYNEWHIDVKYIDDVYVFVVMCKYNNNTDWILFLSTSIDNETYTTPYACLLGKTDAWDERIYRSCIVKVGNEYRIYYSAVRGGYYALGVTVSKSLSNFVGRLTY